MDSSFQVVGSCVPVDVADAKDDEDEYRVDDKPSEHGLGLDFLLPQFPLTL